MASQTRTRARKTADSKAKEETPSQEEIDLAISQENNEYLQAQLGFLQQRVATLRVRVNRLERENERLKNTQDA